MTGSWLVRLPRPRTRPSGTEAADPDAAASPASPASLVCVPYAGGGSSVFAGWPELLPPEVTVYAVQLPGREARLLQPPPTGLDAVLASLGPAVADLAGRRLVLFGHSLGSLIAFELCRWLRSHGLPPPERLLVSARRAPQLPHDRPTLHDLPDDALRERLRGFNGTPPEVLGDTRTMSLLLPTMRADLAMNDTYRYRDDAPLDTPIGAFGGSADPHVDRAGLLAWRQQTRRDFQVQWLPGDHFFVQSARTPLVRAVGATVGGASQRPTAPR